MSFNLLTQNFHTSLAKSFYDDLVGGTGIYYYYQGRVLEWGGNANDLPEEPIDNKLYDAATRQGMNFMTRISASDISFSVPRIDWQSGTVYDAYDDSYSPSNLAPSGASKIDDANIYILTDEFKVYKCIDNAENSPSTIKPTSTSTDYINSTDGYVWKFIFFIPLALRNKFLTSASMPVITQNSNRLFLNGEIQDVTILSGGSGYTRDNTSISVLGDGTGAELDYTLSPSGEILDVIILNPGSGYVNASISIIGDGTGADLSLVFSPTVTNTLQEAVELNAVKGEISRIVLNNSGTGYSNPNVAIVGDGAGAGANALLNADGSIRSIQITDRGLNYNFAEVRITDNTGVGASARAVVSPFLGHGANAIEELYADNITIFGGTTPGENSEAFSTLNNDSRQVGIIKDPLAFNTNVRYRSTLGRCFYVATINYESGQSVVPDQVIYGGSVNQDNEAIVAGIENGNIAISKTSPYIPKVGDNIIDENGINIGSITNITAPEVDKYSGKILFIDNTQPFTDTVEQSVLFRTVFRF